MTAVPTPVTISDEIDSLTFLADRTPETAGPYDWVATLGDYRDGGIFVVHYAGSSQWERHRQGDEVVMVIDGTTTMTLYIDGVDHALTMNGGQLVIVPQGVWHRFDTPEAAKIMTITPQPTDHMTEHPSTADS